MKNIVLLTLLALCTYRAQAQLSTSTTRSVAKTPDTTKQVIPKRIKVRIIGGAPMTSDKDVVDNIAKSKDHTIFTNAITAAGLAETLKSRGPLTVFAPTDAAFKKLAPGVLDTLYKPAHVTDLTRLITNHVISGRFTAKDIAKQIASDKGEAKYTTLTGTILKAKLNGDRNIVLTDELGNESIVSQFDVEQINGIIDVVTGVLVAKTK